MKKTSLLLITLFLLIIFTVSGCATTRAKKPDAAADANNQITQLQGQLAAKDQQLQDMQTRLYAYEKADLPSYTTNVTPAGRVSRSKIINVPGVSVADVQRALTRAGLNPGSADGKAGKKTKSAVRKFQRAHHLPADCVVGPKTWSLLNG